MSVGPKILNVSDDSRAGSHRAAVHEAQWDVDIYVVKGPGSVERIYPYAVARACRDIRNLNGAAINGHYIGAGGLTWTIRYVDAGVEAIWFSVGRIAIIPNFAENR